MRSVAIVLALAVLAQQPIGMMGVLPAFAAKKYYPPGYEISSPAPVASPKSDPVAPAPQLIIKTVPVPVRAKPQDPLVTLLNEQRYTEALRLVDQRLQKSPWNFNLRLTRAQILRERQNFDQSIAEYQRILTRNKIAAMDAKAMSGMGLTTYQQALRLKQLGDTQGSEELMKKAETAFRQSTALYQGNAEAWTGLAQLYLTQNKLMEADAAIAKARRHAPHDPEVLLVQGQVLLAKDKPDAALPYLYKSRQKDSRDPRVNLLLGQAFLKLNRSDDAIIQLQQALEKVPDHAEAMRLLSTAYQNKEKPQDAELVLQKAVSLNPGDSDSVNALLHIYEERGEADRSILLLKSLLKDQPGHRAYQAMLLERLALVQRWDELYDTGLSTLDTLLEDANTRSPLTETALNALVQAAYSQGKAKIDRAGFKQQPAIQKLSAFYTARLAQNPTSLPDRLNLLMLDPLAPAAGALPSASALSSAQLPVALKVAFLRGDWEQHKVLSQRLLSDTTLPPDVFIQTGEDLLLLGDMATARMLAETVIKRNPALPAAIALLAGISETERRAGEQIRGLEMLPGRIPRTQWDTMAEAALRLSSGNFKLHALLAEELMDKKDYSLAWIQQRLAAQYAPSDRERTRWLKKAEKTEEKLTRAKR